jgi:hypothetical protein
MRLRHLAGLLVILAPLGPVSGALGCGPFFPTAIFVYDAHPERPFEPFAAGRLGVLLPGFARSYLVVAYRHLAGRPLGPEEQKAAIELWETRLGVSFESPAQAGIDAWLEARKAVPGAGEPPPISAQRSMSGRTYYFDYLNCAEDAFRTAASTLRSRIGALGASSAATLDWIRAQDQVFANCSGPAGLPADVPAGVDALASADRAYQVAAARFYAGDFEAAEQAFASIAKDAASPWRGLAPYLAARALIRNASIGPQALEGDGAAAAAALLGRAEERLQGVLADPAAAELHPAARRMLGLVRLRLRTEDRLGELARALAGPQPDPEFFQDLWDFTTALDRLAPVDLYAPEQRSFAAIEGLPRAEDLTDWVLTFQVTGNAALEYSLQRWREVRSDAWLVAALAKIRAGHADVPQLLEAAASLQPATPAYETAVHQVVRLLIEGRRPEEARRILDAALASPELTASGRNLFLAQRMRLATNLEELLHDARRQPLVISYNDGPKQEPIEPENLRYLEEEESNSRQAVDRMRRRLDAFDADAARALGSLPLALLAKAAESRELPDHLRRDVALAAWTRSVLLGREETALAAGAQLEALVPELAQELAAYRAASDAASRRWAGLLTILRWPGLQTSVPAGLGRLTRIDRIDDYRDNWWCPVRAEAVEPAGFLDAELQAQMRLERQALAELGTGPNWLAAQALAWARERPDDPRVPEALHLAVRSTRYGCTDEGTGPLSKAAFQLLHRSYPKSPWTKKTPHWFQ